MAIAHIIIEVEESPDLNDCAVRLSFSGGTELQSEEGKTAFYKSLAAVERALESSE
ncbi:MULTISPECIES: hypothetical protein [unclassified Neisseria]|uniref:hypothetical protein n=1 Tax=unclassified Neisseria TaxID=2623750 RepID=UPI001431C360|nr:MULTISPECIES: hypothetical protein [unclassified Neisseria]MBF0803288.1 hypothetical protein [Neisseria sp. 19428wB4_WF04]